MAEVISTYIPPSFYEVSFYFFPFNASAANGKETRSQSSMNAVS